MALAALAGCSGTSLDPTDWWHQAEGGRIAQERPPPPRADAPYPNLAAVPAARPKVDDSALRGRVAAGLVADRANAQYSAGTLLPPLPPSSPPPRPAPPPAAPAGQDAMGASLVAASRDPVPPTPVTARPAPRGQVESSPLAPVPAPGPPAAGAGDAAADTPMPDIPAAPPPPPALAGVSQVTAAAPPPVAPPPVPAPVVLPPGTPVSVAFAEGSAVLPETARAQLRALAASRAGKNIVVAGYGSAPEGDNAAQSRALPLAWERAGAISGALQAAGVPAGALSVSARATGQGGVARLAQ